jgi:hypothetical protein
MYYVMYCQTEEKVYQDINEVANNLIQGWKLYGYTDSKRLAHSLLHECKYY